LEVEVKFAVPDRPTFQRLLEAQTLGGLPLGEGAVAQIRDHYLDTAEGALRAQGYACRLRQEDDRTLGGLKGLGQAAGAFHRREELEVELPGLVGPADWPPGPARALALELAGSRPLLPLLTISQTRHTRPVQGASGALAILSLDDVRVCRDAALLATYLEVEAELAPGQAEDDLKRLAAAIQAEWDLPPQPRSKFERALLLLQSLPAGEGDGPPARGPRARPGLTPDDTMGQAAVKILAFHYGRMLRNEPGTRLGQDPEALHDMRVATRRMRAALRVFEPAMDPKALASLGKGLRRTGRALGPVRDLDVFGQKTLAYRDSLPEGQRGGLDEFLALLQARRETAREEMIAYLDGGKYARFKAAMYGFVDGGGASVPGSGQAVGDVAPAAVKERLAAVLAYDAEVNHPDPPHERLHALRIDCKRLRYTLEFFEEVLGLETRAVIGEVVAVQDHLGAVQDAVVAGDILRDYLATGTWGAAPAAPLPAGPALQAPGVEAYMAAILAEFRHLVVTFAAAWQRIAGPEFRRLVAGAVAAL